MMMTDTEHPHDCDISLFPQGPQCNAEFCPVCGSVWRWDADDRRLKVSTGKWICYARYTLHIRDMSGNGPPCNVCATPMDPDDCNVTSHGIGCDCKRGEWYCRWCVITSHRLASDLHP